MLSRDHVEVNRVNPDKINKKDAKKRLEQEKKEQMERQKRVNELRKNFQVRNQQRVTREDSVTTMAFRTVSENEVL